MLKINGINASAVLKDTLLLKITVIMDININVGVTTIILLIGLLLIINNITELIMKIKKYIQIKILLLKVLFKLLTCLSISDEINHIKLYIKQDII